MTTISEHHRVVTLINVFTVDPAKQQDSFGYFARRRWIP